MSGLKVGDYVTVRCYDGSRSYGCVDAILDSGRIGVMYGETICHNHFDQADVTRLPEAEQVRRRAIMEDWQGRVVQLEEIWREVKTGALMP